MNQTTVTFRGTLAVPGDKSISHRALMFSLLTQGDCKIKHLSPAEDCRSTMGCLKGLGAGISETVDGNEATVTVRSPGFNGLKQPAEKLDAGNSGTTIRLLSGLLAGLPFRSVLDGDASLRSRPMSRVLSHLAKMGAKISYEQKENYAPFGIEGGSLKGMEFDLNIASAQVQTALLLAGLTAEGPTTVRLPAVVRDHTERMFTFIGVPFNRKGDLETSVTRLTSPLKPYEITVPGDISSAAFFMVAAACAPGSELTLTNVGLNPGRTLIIEVLTEMGADIEVKDRKDSGGEPIGTIVIKGKSRLKGATISGDRIAAGIDEIPILALAGAFCDGTLAVRDAAELRVKESDRLSAIADNFRRAGATVEEFEDGFDIIGSHSLNGGSEWNTHGDHRLAMTGLVASLLCKQPLQIDDADCVAVSYPQFQTDLKSLYSA